MLMDDYPPAVKVSEDTIIGGAALKSVMELGRCELYDDLRPADSFESTHLMYLLNVQKIAWDCFKEVPRNKVDIRAREINLRYAMKATETFIRLYDRLETHWAKKNSIPSGERVLVPLKAKTLIDGITLREIMQWAYVELYLELKPQNPIESLLADLAVRLHKAGGDCHQQADWKRGYPDVRELNLKFALKGTEISARLVARLESYRAKRNEMLVRNNELDAKGPKVMSGKFASHWKKQDKARGKMNGNGRHA